MKVLKKIVIKKKKNFLKRLKYVFDFEEVKFIVLFLRCCENKFLWFMLGGFKYYKFFFDDNFSKLWYGEIF